MMKFLFGLLYLVFAIIVLVQMKKKQKKSFYISL